MIKIRNKVDDRHWLKVLEKYLFHYIFERENYNYKEL